MMGSPTGMTDVDVLEQGGGILVSPVTTPLERSRMTTSTRTADLAMQRQTRQGATAAELREQAREQVNLGLKNITRVRQSPLVTDPVSGTMTMAQSAMPSGGIGGMVGSADPATPPVPAIPMSPLERAWQWATEPSPVANIPNGLVAAAIVGGLAYALWPKKKRGGHS